MACKIEKNDREIPSENITMRGTGEPMREFIFTDNLVDAMLLTLERGFTSQGKPINIGSGSEKNTSAPADLNKAKIDFKEEIRLGRSKPNSSCGKLLDNSVLQNFGWSPKTDMKSGIKSSYEWYLAHRSRLAA